MKTHFRIAELSQKEQFTHTQLFIDMILNYFTQKCIKVLNKVHYLTKKILNVSEKQHYLFLNKSV